MLLALLAKEPAHGYELKQAIEQTFGNAYPSPNIGQIYVTLNRLERDGLVVSQDVEQSGRPNKKVNELTAAGRETLAEWIQTPNEGFRIRDDFFVKLALAPLTGATDRNALINQQRRQHLNSMRALNDLYRQTHRENATARLLIEGARLHIQADLDWLERCQEELG
jgi:DNA-binding PadR family transcriptional regulator